MQRRWLLPAGLGALGISYVLVSLSRPPNPWTLSIDTVTTVDRALPATDPLRAASVASRPRRDGIAAAGRTIHAPPERPGREMGGKFISDARSDIEPLPVDAPLPTAPEPVDVGPLIDADDPIVFAIDPASPPVHVGELRDANEASVLPLRLKKPFHVGAVLNADAPPGWELDETSRQPAAIGRVEDAGTPGDF